MTTTTTKNDVLTQNLSIFTIEIAYAAVKLQRMYADKNQIWGEGDAEQTAFSRAESELQLAFMRGKKEIENIRRGGEKPTESTETKDEEMTNVLNEFNQLQIGDVVGDTNRIVVAATKQSERVEGDSYACWVAICHGASELHPYVVWDVIARPEGFAAERGIYCLTIAEAVDVYSKRGGE